jgi:hypothetical protein
VPQLTSHIRPLRMHRIRHDFPAPDMLRCIHARNSKHVSCLPSRFHQHYHLLNLCSSLSYLFRDVRGRETHHDRNHHPLRNQQTSRCRALRIVLRHQRPRDPGWTALSCQRRHDDAVREGQGADAEGGEELACVWDGEGTHD